MRGLCAEASSWPGRRELVGGLEIGVGTGAVGAAAESRDRSSIFLQHSHVIIIIRNASGQGAV